MRLRWPALVSAAGGVLLLVSLYLPWWSLSCGEDSFSCYRRYDPWPGIGEAAALAAVATIAAAALGLGDWTLVLALIAAYFALGDWVWTRVQIGRDAERVGHAHPQLVTGGYLAVAAILLLVGGAIAGAGGARPGLRGAVGLAVASGVLVAVLLPWFDDGAVERRIDYSFPGFALSTATAAAALAVCAALLWWRCDPAGASYRHEVSVAILVLLGGAVATVAPPIQRLAPAWLALGLAFALVAAALPVVLPPATWPALALGSATTLLLVGFFLPWQQACDLGPGFPRCVSSNGWELPTTAAAMLALALVFAALETGAFAATAAEAGIGVALLVSTAGFQQGVGVADLRYGAWVAFAGAAAVAAVSLLSIRLTWPGGRRALELAAPVAACLGYLFVLVVPSWSVLEGAQEALGFAPLSWLSVAGALLAILLLGRWLRGFSAGLVAIPLGMLALAALELIHVWRQEFLHRNWGGGAVVALCLTLALMGRIQQAGLPEILRLDRIETPDP